MATIWDAPIYGHQGRDIGLHWTQEANAFGFAVGLLVAVASIWPPCTQPRSIVCARKLAETLPLENLVSPPN